MRAFIDWISRHISLMNSLNKFSVSGWLALLTTCMTKDKLTPLLFNGKSFFGRNNWFQLGILGLYFLIFLLIFLLISFQLEKWFPAAFAKLAQRIDEIKVKQQKFPICIAVLFIFMLVFVWLLVKNAWVGDDGFITVRVIDNFLNGYGLVWNVGERVQVFTHPLWLFLLLPFHAVLKDPYLVIYWVSLVLSLFTIILVLTRFSGTVKAKIIATLLFASSMAFIDYSSSGLENPLTHLLLVIMLIVVLKSPTTLKFLFFTSLLASFAAINRLDTILFFIPVLSYQFFELRRSWANALGILVLGFLPLLIWEVFALVYFGFPFPNTYYAKFGATSLPADWFRLHAGYYFLNSIQWDPITIVTIFLSILFVFLERDRKKTCLGLGMLFYLIYIVSIGGDFMSGRFFSGLFVLAVALLVSMDFSRFFKKKNYSFFLPLVVLIVFLGLIARFPPALIKPTDVDKAADQHGIANEKLFYFDYTSWYARRHYQTVYPWATMGIKFRETGQKYIQFDSIGFFGYYAGPQVYVFDHLALADPLRSRLPIQTVGRIGHMPREIPRGYEETLMDNFSNHIENPDLHQYYDKLDILIHDDLLSPGRLREILNFNLQKYNVLLADYQANPE